VTAASVEDHADETLVKVAEHPAAGRRRSRRRLWFAHNSGRFDRPASAWRAAITFLRRRASLITGTEAAGRDPKLFRDTLAEHGWGHAHLAGAAEGECYAAWDLADLQLVGRPFAWKLTDKTWTRSAEYGGRRAAKVHALVVRLREVRTGRRWWVVIWHAPLDNTNARAEIWVDCCDGLVDLKHELLERDPDAEVVVVGDVNKNLRIHAEAAAVRSHLTWPLKAVTSWAGRMPRRGGTHTRQVIDYAIARAFAACQLLKDLPDSDHRAFRYRPLHRLARRRRLSLRSTR